MPDDQRRVFVAGATGLMGVRLFELLVDAGHEVAGLTRTPAKAGLLTSLGAQPEVADAFEAIDAEGVITVVDGPPALTG